MTGRYALRELLRAAAIAAATAVLGTTCLAGPTDAPAAAPGAAPSERPALGAWQAADQAALQQATRDNPRAPDRPPADRLFPVVAEFKAMIESDPELYMRFNQMFEQIPKQPPYDKDPVGNPQLRDYREVLAAINRILLTAPEFNQTGLVGFPINAILNWAMGTPAGAAAFLNDKVNWQLKKILNQWSVFLRSPDSRYVLNKDPQSGWFGRDAMAAMPTFFDDFVTDPGQPYYGFTSWDDFFTRQFKPGRRPVASPDDNGVIANSCESAPYRLARNVQLTDRFWLKDQPYSLQHMMADDPLAGQFVGGTVYQAFLSALSYHRWHSPVSGRIVKTRLIDGSYYAQAAVMGMDPASPNESQGYITHTAARALVFIQADDPRIGLMAILFVGMAEVSSNEFTVYEGQHVKKGDQLGMFHFGGSTHAVFFRPQVRLDFDLRGQKPGLDTTNIPVRALLARVR